MKTPFLLLSMAAAAGAPLAAAAEQLVSGEYFVTQSWSQEQEFQRPYFVRVPQRADQPQLPVLIYLHGHGGSGQDAMSDFLRRYPAIAAKYVLAFPDGYRRSWNIVSEESTADDRGFVESIVKHLAAFDNVQPNNFSIMGFSNGAALVNQLAIESRLTNTRNYVSGGSPLNVYQHDGKDFKARDDENGYQTVFQPITGKRLMNISGVTDKLVPYRGGPSPVIPAKDGKLAFVDAEESIFLWARQMGFEGEKLSRPTRVDGNLEMFSYLDGDVIHYKVVDKGHDATHSIGEKILLGFLEGGQ